MGQFPKEISQFENRKEKMKTRRKTFEKDMKSVENQTRAKACKNKLYFENMKEKLKTRRKTCGKDKHCV